MAQQKIVVVDLNVSTVKTPVEVTVRLPFSAVMMEASKKRELPKASKEEPVVLPDHCINVINGEPCTHEANGYCGWLCSFCEINLLAPKGARFRSYSHGSVVDDILKTEMAALEAYPREAVASAEHGVVKVHYWLGPNPPAIEHSDLEDMLDIFVGGPLLLLERDEYDDQ